MALVQCDPPDGVENPLVPWKVKKKKEKRKKVSLVNAITRIQAVTRGSYPSPAGIADGLWSEGGPAL